ncbi:MAG: hypothetical protein HFG92_13560 [Dorea sp.]|jgi:hypothetical protein|nr:hypothetical protein [Dorea sp.]
MRQIKVKILGAELEAPLLNHKVAKRYEDGTKKVIEIANKAMECGVGSEGIEMECNAVIDFIDDIFGPGSAKKVLGEETDLLTCLDAWDDLARLYDEQVHPVLKERNRIARGRSEGLKGNGRIVGEGLEIKNGDI